MLYKTLVDYYEKLESTAKRLEKTQIIADLLKKTTDDEIQDGQPSPIEADSERLRAI